MNDKELIFYLVLVSTNCVIAYYWAMYGFFEVTLDPQRNKPPLMAAFAGVMTLLVGGYLQRSGILKLEVLTQTNMKVAAMYLLCPPAVLMVLVRLFFLRQGTPNYNRARSATQYWMNTGNLKFGHILQTEGENLKNFPRAIKALENFDKAIVVQKKGTVTYSASRVILIADQETDYDGLYRSRCPACGFEMKVPDSPLGVSGQCNMCGSYVTAKRVGSNIHVSAFGKNTKRTIVSTQNKRNIAAALGEKALLLRMMNRFDEAEAAGDEALKFVEDALSDEPGSNELLTLKSLIVFRLAEIAHVKGQKDKAKPLYQQCLAIDESIGNTSDNNLIHSLMGQL